MILYYVSGKEGEEGYQDLAKCEDIRGMNVYVNMTNKCPCSCTFCLRQTRKWLKIILCGLKKVNQAFRALKTYSQNMI